MASDDLLPRETGEGALVAAEARSHPPPGKLETFAVLGAFIGTVPFPWVPDALARRVRGALVHDVSVRHGVTLSSAARRTLADPASTGTKRGALAQAFGYLGRKLLVRFGTLALLPPIRAALETYILGFLLDRYLSRPAGAAPSRGRRLEGEEARIVRAAIDRSVLSIVSPERGLAWPTTPLLADDTRDELTQVVDSILGATTTIPSWLLGRLAVAFDEELPPLNAMSERALLRRARRIVVKIGSRTLASDAGVYDRLAHAVAKLHADGRSVVLVSSGAIALGVKTLGWKARPREMAKLQAAAAAGQTALMRHYEEAFRAHDLCAAQVLLTHTDLADRVRGNNARAAIQALLDAHAVPVLNENDSVSVEEIKFGDNDQLAALVAPLVDADLVILLSDVPGLLDRDGVRIPVIHDVATEAVPHIRAAAKGVGTGGMASKVEAARRATVSGAHAVVADARCAGILEAVVAGDDVGTLFVGSKQRLPAKKSWIAFTLRPRGALVLDAGAVHAVGVLGKSVLPVGVVGVRGDFHPGDAVRLMAPDGTEIGRGLVRCSAADAARLAGTSTRDLPEGEQRVVLVHRDDLVVGVV